MCKVFYTDGSLRDITVSGTDESHWPKVLHHLGATADELTWYGQAPDTDPLATLQDGAPASLAVRYGRTWFTAHLPVDGIEFSLSPEDVVDGRRLLLHAGHPETAASGTPSPLQLPLRSEPLTGKATVTWQAAGPRRSLPMAS
ncbi:hypothetical protein [Streptomyces sp. BPTC-684]|uniref:hypothetical protein n=1 Tax=Streptomyces sp. BPTC-684 TaxID=3043734 RepID=UPI0024B166A2|nr:hypothetical protein [Streptomyces sp. BPTC-684]WHM40964.1 hypothetical protein QIY60_31560 [Streptomyces sp. BPTC-684]